MPPLPAQEGEPAEAPSTVKLQVETHPMSHWALLWPGPAAWKTALTSTFGEITVPVGDQEVGVTTPPGHWPVACARGANARADAAIVRSTRVAVVLGAFMPIRGGGKPSWR
jgi:hypothetical protein